MKPTYKCICSAPLARRQFSRNFDDLHCASCNSSRFVPSENTTTNSTHDFQYNGDNRKYSELSYLHGKQLRWAHHELLKKDWRGHKVLEIGCFNGFLLDELKQRGADVYGLDVNPEAVLAGSKLFGLNGRLHVSLDQLKRHAPFDDIICIDVLEHIDEPGDFLDETKSLLKPGGCITVAGPTVERRFHDQSDFPPHHKWWFSRPGLHSLLNRHALDVINMSIQRNGTLFLRNLVGRSISGMSKREFNGDLPAKAPGMKSRSRRVAYAALEQFGIWIFTFLRISYCSTILVAQKRNLE